METHWVTEERNEFLLTTQKNFMPEGVTLVACQHPTV